MDKKIYVTKSSIPTFEEYTNEIKDIFDSHWLTNMGTKHCELQRKLENYFGCKHVALYTNGHLALENALASFNFKRGSEIITTPFTFVSTIHAIVRNGLKPVFCDIDEDNFTIDARKIEPLISDKTVAILPVHVYGNVCDVEKIEEIAKKNNLKVIYDAAHAFGVKYKGKSVANYGDMSMFSFHATKVFNTIEGGCVCFNDDSKVVLMDDIKNFGIHGPESVDYIGGNAKMNEFQAAMGLCNLRHVDNWIEQRKRIVDCYRDGLKDIKGLKICKTQKDVVSNYAYFPVIFENAKYNRNEVYDKLAKNNIFARKYFYPLITECNCYRDLYSSKDTPIAKMVADSVLTLPLYPDLEKEVIDEIIKIIRE